MGLNPPSSHGGGGGLTAWGEADNAEFHGDGSPVDTVTPSAEGDLYIDEATPGVWQASGATSADWEQLGGGDIAYTRWNGGSSQSADPGSPVELEFGAPAVDGGFVDTSSPFNPEITETGIYAFTMQGQSTDPLTPGGGLYLQLDVGLFSDDTTSTAYVQASSSIPRPVATAVIVYRVVAGSQFSLTLTNQDPLLSLHLAIATCVILQLSKG